MIGGDHRTIAHNHEPLHAVDVKIIDQTLDLFLVARELDAKDGRQLPPHLAKHVFRKRNDRN